MDTNRQKLTEKALGLICLYKAAGLKMVTAESCTGGLIAAFLTEIPGSSAVLECGFVTYSNDAKTQSIGVDASLIEQYGAVSEQVAQAMAVGALQHSMADVAVSVTGIAGPDGGTPVKPVGLVHFAIVRRGKEPVTRRCVFCDADRSMVRLLAVNEAFKLLELILTD